MHTCGQPLPQTPLPCGNVNSFEFEHVQWGTLPPRVGDGFETQEVGPHPLFKSEQPFQKADTAANLEAKSNLDQHGLVQSMTQTMQVQTNMLTAHVQVVAMQNLPALPPFT